MNKRHYEHTLPNIRGSLSNTYISTVCFSSICAIISHFKWFINKLIEFFLCFLHILLPDGADPEQYRIQIISGQLPEFLSCDTNAQTKVIHRRPICRINTHQLHLVENGRAFLFQNLVTDRTAGSGLLLHLPYHRVIFTQSHFSQ